MEFMEQMQSFAPIILMVVIFYFMLWRPQKKQQKNGCQGYYDRRHLRDDC